MISVFRNAMSITSYDEVVQEALCDEQERACRVAGRGAVALDLDDGLLDPRCGSRKLLRLS